MAELSYRIPRVIACLTATDQKFKEMQCAFIGVLFLSIRFKFRSGNVKLPVRTPDG